METFGYLLLLLLFSSFALADEYKFNWTEYQDLDKIYNYMDELKNNHSESVTILEIGKTYEKRPIKVLKIKAGAFGQRAVVIEAGMSASAWLSISTATYIMNELLNSKEKHIQYISERYDWYIAPVLNPDGYDYTWTTDRQWDNNRQPYGKCFGADLNKNFNLNWQYSKRDSNSCIGQFNGFYPHSEVETRSWVDFIRRSVVGLIQPSTLFAYFELLNFGQAIRYLNDYDYSPLTKKQWRLIADNAVEIAADRYGTEYTNLFLMDDPGSSVSWVAKNIRGVKLPFAIQHRGFESEQPPDQILPNAQEIFDSLVSIILQGDPLTTDFDKDNK